MGTTWECCHCTTPTTSSGCPADSTGTCDSLICTNIIAECCTGSWDSKCVDAAADVCDDACSTDPTNPLCPTPAPTTPAPTTPEPTTPAPTTPAPITPTPTIPAPTTPEPTTPAPITPNPTSASPITPNPTTVIIYTTLDGGDDSFSYSDDVDSYSAEGDLYAYAHALNVDQNQYLDGTNLANQNQTDVYKVDIDLDFVALSVIIGVCALFTLIFWCCVCRGRKSKTPIRNSTENRQFVHGVNDIQI